MALFGWGQIKIINPDGKLFSCNEVIPQTLSAVLVDKNGLEETVRKRIMLQDGWKVASYEDEPEPSPFGPFQIFDNIDKVTINKIGEIINE